jgi:hypothetical protein
MPAHADGHDPHAGHGAPASVVTKASCRANDSAFLTTLAYCINIRCTSVPVKDIEHYWIDQASGDPHTTPKWNYVTTLQNVNGTPNDTYASGRTINTTMLVSEKSYNIQIKWLPTKEHNSHLMYKYT